VRGLLEIVPRVVTLLTPNATRVIAPRDLSVIEGNTLVESYFDETILPRHPTPGAGRAVFVQHLEQAGGGIADNLALSVVAEAIGRRTPVLVRRR